MPSNSRQQRTQSIGDQIKHYRQDKSWSTQKLADESRVSVGAISAAENGISVPNTTTLLALAKALGVSMKQLTGA